MTKPVKTITVITSVLWVTAIISSAILKAPFYFTLMLLPMFGLVLLTTVVAIGRRMRQRSRSLQTEAQFLKFAKNPRA